MLNADPREMYVKEILSSFSKHCKSNDVFESIMGRVSEELDVPYDSENPEHVELFESYLREELTDLAISMGKKDLSAIAWDFYMYG